MKHITTEEFIKRAKNIHGNKYDYSKVNYVRYNSKVCIICPEHGEFWMTPDGHTNKTNPHGCPKCNGGTRLGVNTFIEKAKEVHGDKYDYSKVVYKNTHLNVLITCPMHGDFEQTPHNHLKGKGCKFCANNQKLSNSDFIKKAKQIHGDRYDYSKVNYVNNTTKVCIICKEHGEFWQRPDGHLRGKGCWRCNSSHLERIVEKTLIENEIEFVREANSEVLSFLGRQRLDFFLPKYNVAIECQGTQHFQTVPFFKSYDLSNIQERDLIKKKKCEENNIKLLYFSNLEIDYPYKVFENIDDLMKEIKAAIS